MRKINKIIVHCSATREGQDISLETIRRWHIIERGWSDIGYHYVITLNGEVKEGRPLERSGAHCKGHNRSSIGVCYVGGCDDKLNPKDTRTDKQKEALVDIITALKQEYPNAVVYGHNDFSDKACPSFNAKEEYKDA